MFTGIIRHLGKLEEISKSGSSLRLRISSDLRQKLQIDQSVSHDGICLTVDRLFDDSYGVTAVKETLDKTTLGSWSIGKMINLETAATPSSALDGHIVQGHVDGVSELLKIEEVGGSWYFHFSIDRDNSHLLVEKGSICINGVSLTIAGLKEDSFIVAIIPYTYDHTSFSGLQEGDRVNIEYDLIGKYVNRMLQMKGVV
jgi:riboflavin synthase